jgi:hypothetical protein
MNDPFEAQNKIAKVKLAAIMEKFGCLPSAPDGPVIDSFTPTGLAHALESEIERSKIYGWNKITIHMDLIDAIRLLEFLRG